MTQYFWLQYLRIKRGFREFGIAPILGFLIISSTFIGLSLILFEKTLFAAEVYLVISVTFTSRLSDITRNEFLLQCFGKKRHRNLRITENLLVSAPFILFLFIEQYWPEAVVLAGTSTLLAVINFRVTLNFTLPTPFSKRPFEFTAGFRNTFYIFLLCYTLAIIAVTAENFNLGIFAMIAVFMVTYGFYLKPEPDFYIWIFNCRPGTFLFRKIRTAILYSVILALPVVLITGFTFGSDLEALFIFLLLGLVFLATVILAKYSAYPREINLPEILLIILSMILLPLLILVLPYFYIKAVKKLSPYLV